MATTTRPRTSTAASRITSKDPQRLKALGHPVRLGIAMQLAAEPETCACDFAEVFGVSQPTVSEHLRVLVQAGLLRPKRIKQWTFYKRDEKRIAEVKRVFGSAW